MPVLLIDDGTPNPYLQAVFASDSFFNSRRTPAGNVDYAGLAAYPLIVLSDIKLIPDGLARQLGDYVKGGGTLAVFPADGAETASYRNMLRPLGAAYPGEVINESTKVTSLNLQNTLFRDVFDNVPQNPDLPAVNKYYNLTGGLEAIMKLPGNTVFWGSNAAGKGRVYISAVPLDNNWSNLQRHGLFVPVMYRIALLSGRDMPLFYTLGTGESIETIPISTAEKEPVSIERDNMRIIPDVRHDGGSTWLYLPGQLRRAGLYNLGKQDSLLAILAFNDNRSESDLSYTNRETLAKMLTGKQVKFADGAKPAETVSNALNNGIQLWKLCIILALIFLAAEILLIRYYKTDRRALQSRV